ncbi:MAG: hypothetical protein ACXWI1_01870 [Croceibacterium sp.]
MIIALVGSALLWEALKLFVSLRQRATKFAGVRFERETSPKRYWSLIALHGSLWLFVVAVFVSLFTGVWP